MTKNLEVASPSGRRLWSHSELASRANGDRIGVAELVPDDPEATHATFESADGSYRASIPIEAARRQGTVVVETGGLRLIVEDGDTLCWNVKDLGLIRLTVGAEPDSVPENPTH